VLTIGFNIAYVLQCPSCGVRAWFCRPIVLDPTAKMFLTRIGRTEALEAALDQVDKHCHRAFVWGGLAARRGNTAQDRYSRFEPIDRAYVASGQLALQDTLMIFPQQIALVVVSGMQVVLYAILLVLILKELDQPIEFVSLVDLA
jgi:hypothetical protein